MKNFNPLKPLLSGQPGIMERLFLCILPVRILEAKGFISPVSSGFLALLSLVRGYLEYIRGQFRFWSFVGNPFLIRLPMHFEDCLALAAELQMYIYLTVDSCRCKG